MLSVVLATHNEEKNLPACLDAVYDLAQEIIIVDGESTDATCEVAARYGAKIIATTNKSNFHINKQMAMDAATGDLILQLDADEVVDAQLHEFIKSLLSPDVLPHSPAAWYIARKNYFFGRFLTKGGQYPDAVIRLYQKGAARLPQKNVHEQMEVTGSIGTADGHLLHYATPTLSVYIEKFNRYTSFEAERIAGELPLTVRSALSYSIGKPLYTFFSLFARHRGYVDGISGFLFALLSALHHPFVYLKVLEIREKNRQ